MSRIIVGVFERFLLAEDAIKDLQAAGIARNDISIAAREANTSREHGREHGREQDGSGMAAGAGAGAALGGVAGLIVGLTALAIPGIGPLLAAGPLAAALGSAGLGAAAGGLIGALTGMNIPEDDANYYAETVRNGGAVVIVKAEEANTETARDVLNRAGALNVKQNESGENDPHSSDPAAPQVNLSGARIYEDGLEMNPRKSRFKD